MRRAAAIGLLCVLSAAASAQTRPMTPQGTDALDCKACHTAKIPTKKNPALLACPRLLIKDFYSVTQAPPMIVLGDTGGVYGPVKFSHRVHAQMAETGRGCNGCHHYDQAQPIQKCSACHSTTRARADLGKPDLQAAIHRQCLTCHLEWSPASKCASCHQPLRESVKGAAAPASAKSPSPVAPARIVYQTGAEAGKTVTFFHNEHVTRFALACSACHQQESCAACHRASTSGQAAPASLVRTSPPGRTATEAHVRCAACHTTASCALCHSGTGARSSGFDHRARTGWALNRFHASLACTQCHTTPGRYAKVAADCVSCHTSWPASFKHSRTGLTLDEAHATLDCVSCHNDKTFRAPPVCSSCHDDKTYPAAKPGTVVAHPVTRR